jgi:peptidyl-prolyl cis-trans isomerase B (cyclophilin B)
MHRLRRLPLAASALALLAVAAGAASQTPPAAPPPAAAPADPLRRDFDALATYLSRKGALSADDRANAAALAGRIRESLATADTPTGWAMLAQIGVWTDDPALQDEAFAALLDRQPRNETAMAQWIAALNRRADYDRAITETNSRVNDVTKTPRVRLALVETFVGQNRFDDARAALGQLSNVPPDLNLRKMQLETRVAQLAQLWAAEEALRAADDAAATNPIVEFVTSKGVVRVELFEGQAPESVHGIVALVDGGTYNGTRFHRRIPGFAVLGGDPNSKPGAAGRPGWGTVGWRLPDEGAAPGHRVAFSGAVGLCKAVDPKSPGGYQPNSAGAQFFFTLQPAEFLQDPPLAFATIGRIVDGFDVATQLAPGDEIVAARTVRKGKGEAKPGGAPDLATALEMSVPSSKPLPAQRPPGGAPTITPGTGAPPVRPATR